MIHGGDGTAEELRAEHDVVTQKQRVVGVEGRMIRREVEGAEVVPVRFDLGPLRETSGTQDAQDRYLRLLARLSGRLKQDEVRKRVMAAKSPDEIVGILSAS